MRNAGWPGGSAVRRRLAGVVLLLAATLCGPAPATAQPSVEAYRLGSGDVLAITVFGEPDLSVQGLRIPVDGVVSYPLIGDIEAAGETVKTLEDKLVARLRDGYLLYPQVSISIEKYRPFYVGGMVQNPGVQEYAPGMNVGKAVALAGGVRERGDEGKIRLQRFGESEPRLVGVNEAVFPGDVITVGEKEAAATEQQRAASYVYLYGEVNRPGRYEYFDGMTIEKAIATAGGFSPRASRRKINVKREGDPPIELSTVTLNTPLLDGDVVTVGASIF